MEIQRESIFISALRGFCRSFFILLGIFAAIVASTFIYSSFSSPHQSQEKTTLEILPDLEWNHNLVSLSAPAILQINIHGVIGDPEKLDSQIVKSILVDSRSGLLSGDRVKGILLHFDTPGGTVTDSDNIYRLLLAYKEKYKVPVYGYINGMCASGGMYIASAADKLYCSPVGIVGSVGVVIGPFFNLSDAISKLGVEAKTLTEGLDKDMMNPFRSWKPNEDESLKEMISYFYQQFVDVVTTGRPNLNKESLIGQYGARVYEGNIAQQYGYVDVAESSYENALAALMKESDIDADKPYQIVQLKPEHHFLADLMRGDSPLSRGKVEHQIQIGSDKTYAIRDRFAYLYQP
jgi:signal peptide peptidase SppA